MGCSGLGLAWRYWRRGGGLGSTSVPSNCPRCRQRRSDLSEPSRVSAEVVPLDFLENGGAGRGFLDFQDCGHIGIFRMSALSATQISQKRRSFGSSAPSLPRGTTRILLNLGCRSIFDCSSTLQMFFVSSLVVLGLVSHSTRTYSYLTSVLTSPSRSGR